MNSQPIRVLIVEDDAAYAHLVQARLTHQPPDSFASTHVTRLSAALECLAQEPFDVILLDLSLPDSNGLRTLTKLLARASSIPIVVLSGLDDESLALEAVQAGAQDYLVKGDDHGDLLTRTLRYAIERHRIDQALHESEQRYRQMFEEAERLREYNAYIVESMAEGLAVEDTQGRFTFVNLQALKLLGFSAEELVGQPWQTIVAPEERAHVEARSAHRPAGQSDFYETSLHAKDGRVIPVLVSAVPFLKNGQYGGTLITFTDITERKEAEARYRRLVEQIPAVTYILSAGPDERTLYISPQIEAMLGFTPEECLADSGLWIKQLHPDDRERVLAEDARAAETGHFLCEYRVLARDGRVVWVHDECRHAFDDQGRFLYAQGLEYDITERKQAEARLTAFAELGQQLNGARTPEEAARIILGVADALIGWDSCSLNLYSSETDGLTSIVTMDIVEGRRADVPPAYTGTPSPIARRVIAEGRLLIFRDALSELTSELRLFGDTARPSESMLFVPIRNGAHVAGILSIQSYTPHTYDEAALNTLQALADYCGGALDRLRAGTEIRQRSEELAALNQIGLALSHLAEPAEIFETVYATIGKVLDNRNLYIALYDEARQEISFSVYSMKGERRPPSSRPARNGLTEYVLRTQAPLLIPRQMEATLIERGITPFGTQACSYVAVPVRVGAKALGVIALQDYDHEDTFSARDVELLTTIASQTAAALDNARLYEAQARQTAELSAIAELSAALRTAQSRGEMMPVILDQVLGLLNIQDVGLALYDASQHEIIIELGRGVWAAQTGEHRSPGQGISGWVIANHQTYWNNAAHTDPRLARPDLLGDIQAIVCVPLATHNETLGALWIGRGRDITQDEVHLLTAIADIAASAIRRESLHEETRRRAEQLAIGNRLGRALAETLDLPRIYAQVHQTILQLLPDTATLFISAYDPEYQEIRCLYALLDGEMLPAAELPPLPLEPPGHGAQSECIRTGQPVIVNDFNARLQQTHTSVTVGTPGQRTQSALYAPMITKGLVTGVLQVQSYTLNRFSEAEANLLSFVANAAAIAIENAQLFAKARQQVEHLQALRQIDMAITGSVEMSVTMNVVLNNAMRELNAAAASVLLLDPHTQTLGYAFGHGFRDDAITRSRIRLGDGPAGQAALESRIVSLSDASLASFDAQRAKLLAGEDFRAYHAAPLIAKGQVKGVLEVFHRVPIQADPEWLSFFEMLAGQAAIAVESAEMFNGLQRSNFELNLAYDATIEGWSRALDLRDKETEGHSQRVTELTLQLARAMGMSDEELLQARRGALLHDIGKMGIPDGILLKPGKLTDEEWEIMRKHPAYAYEMLLPITYLRPALDIPYCHHEKWDGTGYPRKLKGEQIPLAARVFAIVDVWDALRSDRPYRPAWPDDKAREHIRSLSGAHFDPEVVIAFLALAT